MRLIVLLARRRRRQLSLEHPLTEPRRLVLVLDSSRVEVRQSSSGALRVTGWAAPGGGARLEEARVGGLPAVKLVLRDAEATLEAPMRALAAVCDSSMLELRAPEPLEYVALRADSCGARLEAGLSPAGGLYAALDSSSLEASLAPAAPGDYWLDLNLDSSGARIAFKDPKTYMIQEQSLEDAKLEVRGGRSGEETQVRVLVRVRADSSTITLE